MGIVQVAFNRLEGNIPGLVEWIVARCKHNLDFADNMYSPSHLRGDIDFSLSSGDLLLETFLLSSLPLLRDLPGLERLLDLEESALLRLRDRLKISKR